MKSKLTKAELIKNINDSTGIDAVSIGIVINQMFEELKEALIDNRTIELRGFGTFAPKICDKKRNDGRRTNGCSKKTFKKQN